MKVQCHFRTGQASLVPLVPLRLAGGFGWLGNPWRGALLLAGVGLAIYGLLALGGILAGLAILWAVVAVIRGRWSRLVRRHRAFLALAGGDAAAGGMLLADEQPGSALWWHVLTACAGQGRWQQVAEMAAQLPADDGDRQYVEAVAALSLGDGRRALSLCPYTAAGRWQMVKAQALFQLGQWKAVAEGVRPVRGRDRVEILWLKGCSYLKLGRFRAAARLLSQVVEQGGGDYGNAASLLEQARKKLG